MDARGLMFSIGIVFSIVCADILLTTSSARADAITYTEEAVLSGILDGTSFTDATVTITATGDTANITNPSPNRYINIPLQGTVSVAGVGTDTFSSLLEVVLQGKDVVGIALASGTIILTTSGAFPHYELNTSFGPISGDGIFNADFSYATGLGSFILDETSPEHRLGSARSTFTASGPAAPVPEPATLMLFAAGLVGFGTLRRRRKA